MDRINAITVLNTDAGRREHGGHSNGWAAGVKLLADRQEHDMKYMKMVTLGDIEIKPSMAVFLYENDKGVHTVGVPYETIFHPEDAEGFNRTGAALLYQMTVAMAEFTMRHELPPFDGEIALMLLSSEQNSPIAAGEPDGVKVSFFPASIEKVITCYEKRTGKLPPLGGQYRNGGLSGVAGAFGLQAQLQIARAKGRKRAGKANKNKKTKSKPKRIH